MDKEIEPICDCTMCLWNRELEEAIRRAKVALQKEKQKPKE